MINNKKKGFTLIELLIVITIIGILAVAIIAAVNPVEQIRRAQDQRRVTDGAELLNAFERYYTGLFVYPWDTLGEGAPSQTLVRTSWLNELVAKDEVKSQFTSRSSWAQTYVTQAGQLVNVCSDPQSKTFQTQADAAGRYRDGTPGCTTNCYDCLPK